MNPATEPAPPHPRRHDLDALRAAAMLLGLAYHASLSFAANFPWLVQDVSQTRGMYLFQAVTHGFRMPLFFLISGFFTAMLWRKRGLKALLKQRFRRIFLPCMLGLVTVVPAVLWASGKALEARARPNRTPAARPPAAASDLWTATAAGDAVAVARHLAAGADPNAVQPQWGTTPLTLAALRGDTNVGVQLLDRGARVDGRNNDGGTALHAAAFLGRTDFVDLLLARGADVRARNRRGDTALSVTEADWGTTAYIAGLFQLDLDRGQVEAGRAAVVRQLERLGVERHRASPVQQGGFDRVVRALIDTPVFLLVWFLWFLCWLVGAFALYAWIASRWRWRGAPRWLVLSPAGLLVLVPLTMIPQSLMGATNAGFGPDTYMGILPAPHMLLYYALFFGFGALYYDCDDAAGLLGRRWRVALPATLLLVFPLALEFATGTFGFRQSVLPERFHALASAGFQALYAWLMTFACMGMFRALLTRESAVIRYLSDSAYWLYLAHLPPLIWAQVLIRDWPLPALFKCALLTLGITGVLLLIYDKAVRYTWLGTLLNGRRVRAPLQPSPGAETPVT